MQKIKPLLPSLRENKRYLAFKVISREHVNFADVEQNIKQQVVNFVGELGYAKMGVIFLRERWNKSKQTGVIKVNHKYVSELKMAMALIKSMAGERVVLKSIGVSGILKKTNRFMI